MDYLHIYKIFLYVCYAWFSVGNGRLSKPHRIRTAVLSSSTIKVQWEPASSHKNLPHLMYKVRYAKVNKRKTFKTAVTRGTSIVIDELRPNTTYEFSVRAQEGKGHDRVSSWSSASLNKTLKFVSGTVSELEAKPLSSTSILLSWRLPPQRNRTTGFHVLWSEIEKDLQESRVAVSKQSNSSLFIDLIPYRLYSFRVVTVKANGVEKSTSKVFARPYQDKPSQAPRNLTLTLLDNSVLHVKWLPPPVRKRNGKILTYRLQYRRKGARKGDICTITRSERPRRYNLTELRRGETYRVRLAARTVNGTGPYSKWASIEIPKKLKGKRRKTNREKNHQEDNKLIPYPKITQPPSNNPSDDHPDMPEGLVATALSSTSIKLVWNIPDSPACCPIVAYTIHVTNLDNLKDEKEIVTGPNTVEIIQDLDPSTYYGFNVTAFNTQGVSHDSEEVIQKTKEPVPPTIIALYHTNATEGGIVNLTCIAKGDPLPWVSWHSTNSTAFTQPHAAIKSFNSRKPDKGTNEMTVVFQDVSTRQAGKYMCVAKNVAGTLNSTVDLQVMVPARLTEVEGGLAMIESSINLTCSAIGIPLPTIRWFSPRGHDIYGDSRVTIREWVDTQTEYEQDGDVEVLHSVLHLQNIVMADGGNYTCQAHNGIQSVRRKAELQIEVPPPPPVRNLKATPVSPSVVLVSWERPEYNYAILSYKVIYRKKDSGVEQSIDTVDNSCHISDLTPSKIYKVKVLSFNKKHGEPNRIEFRTLPNKNLQPANVSAVAVNTSIIRLDWEAPYNIDRIYIQGYNIYYRKENGSSEEKLYTQGSRNKQFLIALGKQEIYYLRIATLMTWGDEFPSQWIKIKKSAQELLPPPEPVNVLVVAASEKVRITWESPVGKGRRLKDLKGYRIVYGPKDDTTAKIKKIRVSKLVNRHTITGLQPGTAYIISLRSFNDYGESSPIYMRTTTKATRPGPVQSASATPLSSTTILVSWLTPTRGQATDYHVRYWRPFKNDKQSNWMKAPQTNVTVTGLRKFREYKFEIIPYHEGEIGESTVLFARTKSDVPDAPPRRIRMKAINATAMLIRWEAPPKAQQNGRITGYKLVFKRLKSNRPLATFTVGGNRKNYTFYGLEPSMSYKARVAAMTIRGTGIYSKWHSEKTLQVEKLPPERPSTLMLSGTERSIFVNWTMPRYTGASIDGYIIGYGRYIPEVNRQIVKADVLSYMIKSLRENTEYIISVRAFNKYGESSAKYDFIKTKPVPLQLEPPGMIKALTHSHTAIYIYWIDPFLKKPRLRDNRQYTLRYSSESDVEYSYTNASQPPVLLQDLKPNTKYEFAIRVVRGHEFSKWSLPESNTTYDIPTSSTTESSITDEPKTQPSASIGNRTIGPHDTNRLNIHKRDDMESGTEGGSSVAPYDINITLHDDRPNTVDVSWSPPMASDGEIIGYSVYYSNEENQSLLKWWTVDVVDTMTKLNDLMENSTYILQIKTIYLTHHSPFSSSINFTTPPKVVHEEFPEPVSEQANLSDINSTSAVSSTASTIDLTNKKSSVSQEVQAMFTTSNQPTTMVEETPMFDLHQNSTTPSVLTDSSTDAPDHRPPPPVDLVLTSTAYTITAVWTQPDQADDITGYIVRQTLITNHKSQHVEKIEDKELSVILFDLEPNTNYTISVQSVNQDGVSDTLSEVIATKDSSDKY